jgi:predicted AAA+ superfamily ATPase
MLYRARQISSVLLRDLDEFPVITLTGPRQSGKSTLLKTLLPEWSYVNLEEPALRSFATDDPRGFLKTYCDRVIFDEIQRVPEILSQMQVNVDADRRPGRFAITGSHNLLLLEKTSQSLAGRTAIRNLLPFSFHELQDSGERSLQLEEVLFRGGYPLMQNVTTSSSAWLDSYIQTYVERDVRQIRNVTDLATFQRFVRLCAGRASQLLDLSGLGGDCGISHNTAKDWISVLEAGFIAFRLEPFHRNFSKRIVKSPKLYFYDTGLLCRLLDIRTPSDLVNHPFRGAVFENWCVLESMKAALNDGRRPALYFWRDQQIEVDLLIERSVNEFDAIECKSSATAITDFISSPLKLKALASGKVNPLVVYGGDETQKRTVGVFYGWQAFSKALNTTISHNSSNNGQLL